MVVFFAMLFDFILKEWKERERGNGNSESTKMEVLVGKCMFLVKPLQAIYTVGWVIYSQLGDEAGDVCFLYTIFCRFFF